MKPHIKKNQNSSKEEKYLELLSTFYTCDKMAAEDRQKRTITASISCFNTLRPQYLILCYAKLHIVQIQNHNSQFLLSFLVFKNVFLILLLCFTSILRWLFEEICFSAFHLTQARCNKDPDAG